MTFAQMCRTVLIAIVVLFLTGAPAQAQSPEVRNIVWFTAHGQMDQVGSR
jgi:hypothetical protein